MPDNRVSAVLSEADQQAVMAAINTIRQKLPFLIDLTPEVGYSPFLPGCPSKKAQGSSSEAELSASEDEGD